MLSFRIDGERLLHDNRYTDRSDAGFRAYISSIAYCCEFSLWDCLVTRDATWMFSRPECLEAVEEELFRARLWVVDGRTLQVFGKGKLFELVAREPISKALRAKVVARDGLLCGICGGDVEYNDVHLDHVRPVLLGGPTVASNLRVTHSQCNLRRPKRPEEFIQ